MIKHKLTIEQHFELSKRVKSIREELSTLHIEISVAFGKSKSVSKNALKVLNDLETFRSDLDNEYFRLGAKGNSPYYGAD